MLIGLLVCHAIKNTCRSCQLKTSGQQKTQHHYRQLLHKIMANNIVLTDEQLELLVEKVTEKVIENVYISIGESIVKKFFWVIGLGTVALFAWLGGNGHLK